MAWLPRKKESVSFFLRYSEASVPSEPHPKYKNNAHTHSGASHHFYRHT